jgi:hypothetical protein
MKIFLIALSLVALVGCKERVAPGASSVLNYGKDSQEAILEFNGYFLADPKDSSLSEAEDLEKIDRQAKQTLQHLFGIFQFQGVFIENPAIPFGNPEWNFLNIEETENETGQKKRKVNYHFRDRTLIRSSFFAGAPTSPKVLELRLPIDIKTFYKLGLVTVTDDAGRKLVTKPCTDPHYSSESDFWYFWNPDRVGCPAELRDKGTVAVTATFSPLPNTVSTYPEYGRLGTEKSLSVYVVFGAEGAQVNIAADPEKMSPSAKDAFEKDAGQVAYQAFIKRMVDVMKYEQQKPSSHRRTILTSTVGGRVIEVHAGLFKTSPTDKELGMRTDFEDFYREGFEKGDVIIYNGHSGLGGALPPKRFFGADSSVQLSTKYQIALLNGCSTYAYYRDPYFERKGGTKNLDIISTGLETWFNLYSVVSSNLIFYLGNRQNSWQSILDNFFDVTGQSGLDAAKYSAHFTVNGDEDNPTTLSAALNAQPK